MKKEGVTRNSILKAAEKLFALKGFELTTVREIAKDSGVNIAMIYYYFKTKERLHQTVFKESYKLLSDSLKSGISRSNNPEEKIYDVIKVYITFLHDHKNLLRIIIRETVLQPKHIEMIVNKHISKNFELIHNIIKKGIQNDVFRKQDSVLSTFSLMGMILYYFTYEPIFLKLISSKKRKKPAIEYLSTHIFDLFMQGARK